MMDARRDDGNGQTANVAHVEAFLNSLGSRSPQEAIGMRNDGGLRDGMIVGAIGLVFVVAVGTAVPFFLEKPTDTAAKPTAKPAAQAPAEGGEPATTNATTQPAAGGAGQAANAGEAVPDPDRVLGSLGIGEAKTAAPDSNPRESELDNLLDGVK